MAPIFPKMVVSVKEWFIILCSQLTQSQTKYLRLVSWEQRIMIKTQSGSLKSYLRKEWFILALTLLKRWKVFFFDSLLPLYRQKSLQNRRIDLERAPFQPEKRCLCSYLTEVSSAGEGVPGKCCPWSKQAYAKQTSCSDLYKPRAPFEWRGDA